MCIYVDVSKQNLSPRIKTHGYCIHYLWDRFDHMRPLDVPVEREDVDSKSLAGKTRAISPRSLPPLTKPEYADLLDFIGFYMARSV